MSSGAPMISRQQKACPAPMAIASSRFTPPFRYRSVVRSALGGPDSRANSQLQQALHADDLGLGIAGEPPAEHHAENTAAHRSEDEALGVRHLGTVSRRHAGERAVESSQGPGHADTAEVQTRRRCQLIV